MINIVQNILHDLHPPARRSLGGIPRDERGGLRRSVDSQTDVTWFEVS